MRRMPASPVSRRSRRPLGAALVALLPSLAPGLACVDTTLPDLSLELGTGRTDGAFCPIEVLQAFPPEELRIHLIDVGQGDAIWVRTPWFGDRLAESRNILVDAGPSGNVPDTSRGGDVVVDHLLANGLAPGDMLHAMIVTHAHEDHYGGAERVASTFEVGAWVDPGFSADSPGFLNTRSFVENRVNLLGGHIHSPAIPSLAAAPFDPVDIFGPLVQADILWAASTPPTGSASSPSGTDVNNTSIAFALRWGFRQVLLMADLEEEVEERLVAAHDAGEIDLRSAVLKVAHHGSSSSTSDAFLARVLGGRGGGEDWAVISSGRRSFSGTTLPTPETVARLKGAYLPNHVLSTENRDDVKEPGTEHGDDHIIVRVRSDGLVEACYVP
jgi:beta-lactamase superfamily II metal-dependent hydrolase